MAHNTKDIKTVSKAMAKGTVYNIGGRVAPGQKRYITFVALESRGASTLLKGSGVRFVLVSDTISNTTVASMVALTNAAAYGRLLDTDVRATKGTGLVKPPLCFPQKPNLEAPLFSIASSMFVNIMCTGTSGHAFIQYYDE